MPDTACLICAHPDRISLDQQITAGVSQRALATRFGLPKSSLQRALKEHQAHTPAAEVPGPTPTTADARAALHRLRERHAAAVVQVETGQTTMTTAQERYVQCLWKEQGVHASRAARDAAQAAVDAAEEQVHLLAQGIQEAERTLRATEEYWQAQQRAHWQVVLTHLHDPYEIWVTRITAHHVWVPHPDGRQPYPGEQEQYWSRVQEKFPWTEGASPLAPAPPQDLPRRRAIALQPFAYGDRMLRAGEAFDLVGAPNDDALLTQHYCRELRAEVTHG